MNQMITSVSPGVSPTKELWVTLLSIPELFFPRDEDTVSLIHQLLLSVIH